MSSSGGAERPPPPPLGELADVLAQLVPLLALRRTVSVRQRQAVAEGDVQRLLALTAEQEAVDVRLVRLDHRRAGLQRALEAALDVRGLDAVVRAGVTDAAGRASLHELVAALREEVVRLHEENGRCAALLASAIALAQRTRRHLQQLAGAAPAYPPGRPTPTAPEGAAGAALRPEGGVP